MKDIVDYLTLIEMQDQAVYDAIAERRKQMRDEEVVIDEYWHHAGRLIELEDK